MPISNYILRSRIQGQSRPSADFFILLGAATVIASLGLVLNNQPAIIGAMIIAPLLRPLMGLSVGTLARDGALLRRSLFTLMAGSLAGIMIAYGVALCLHSVELTQEMIARTQPTWLDLGIAIFAGAVAAYCQTRRNASDTLAGVSIAVALVPPLAVVGIGLAHQSFTVAAGAALLYMTNLVGIVASSVLAFWIMGSASLSKTGGTQKREDDNFSWIAEG